MKCSWITIHLWQEISQNGFTQNMSGGLLRLMDDVMSLVESILLSPSPLVAVVMGGHMGGGGLIISNNFMSTFTLQQYATCLSREHTLMIMHIKSFPFSLPHAHSYLWDCGDLKRLLGFRSPSYTPSVVDINGGRKEVSLQRLCNIIRCTSSDMGLHTHKKQIPKMLQQQPTVIYVMENVAWTQVMLHPRGHGKQQRHPCLHTHTLVLYLRLHTSSE